MRSNLSLRSDERGMILVIAIPMAALAVGCLFYLAGMGDVAGFRARLQDAADATALESATFHARAMNAAVSLNLLLAALACLSGLLRAFVWVGVAALALLDADPAFLASARAAEQRSLPPIEAAIQVVAQTQEALSAAAPVLATTLASADNTALYFRDPAAGGAVALSFAALPLADQRELSAEPHRPWQLTAADGSGLEPNPERAGHASLPLVQPDPAAHCDSLRRTERDAPSDRFARLLGGQGAAQRARSLAARLHVTLSATLADPLCAGSAAPPVCGPGSTRCERFLAPVGAGALRGPARIAPHAWNGNALLQVWSVARDRGPRYETRDEQGMDLLSATRSVDIRANTPAFAQAEFYFDCAGDWSQCGPEAALSPRWNARLRRYERPDGPSGGARVRQAFLRSAAVLDPGLFAWGIRAPRPTTTARAAVAALFDRRTQE